MTKEEIKEKIEQLKIDIDESENEIASLEDEIEDLERDLDYERDMLEDNQRALEHYQKELLKLQSPEEQISYWIEYIHDETRPAIAGQFERNGKWYVCNGFVILESNKKLDCLKECEGMDSIATYIDKTNQERFEYDIDSTSDEELLGENIHPTDNLCINGTYLASIKHILQLDNNSKFYYAKGGVGENPNATAFICENENGRALILGRVLL